MAPAQHEPEDILSGTSVEENESEDSMESDDASAPSGRPTDQGEKLRLVMIIVASISGVFILVVGGLFAYQKFFVHEDAPVTSKVSDLTEGANKKGDLEEPVVNEGEDDEMVGLEEEPVVEPTPVPEIPEPSPIGGDPVFGTDSDEDGLSDAVELQIGTDYNSSDTDGDGLSDGDEQRNGSDPLVADTDGDDLSDGDELYVWNTDPLQSDTDGDGYSDGSEVQNGYNPLGAGKLPDIR